MKHLLAVLLFGLLVLRAVVSGAEQNAGGHQVFQDLTEATRRIRTIGERRYRKLIHDGMYQPDVLIFNDTETGAEIWSLTKEACIELANIERRSPWNADGSRIALVGNRRFINPETGELDGGRWAGHKYLMDGNLTRHRRLWVELDGKLVSMSDKFNTWDRHRPNVLYYTANESLLKVTVSNGGPAAKGEVIFTFPTSRRKILQEISDSNILLVQDINARSPDEPMPNYYVIDLSKDPSDPAFCRSHPLSYGGITGVEGHDPENEYHVHGIHISRDGKTISWNYGPMESVGEYVSFSVPADDLDARPTPWNKGMDPWGQYMSHAGTGPDGAKAYFGGPSGKLPVKGDWGLWIRPAGGELPIWSGASCPGGHVTWVGFDPDWFFASVSRHPRWQEKRYLGRIVRGKADGTHVSVICNPYDRQRSGKAGYDGIPRPIQSPDATKCWYHSSMLMPDNTFTGSYIAVSRRPYPPMDLRLVREATGVELEWTPHPISREVAGYHVYRGESGSDEYVLLTDEPVRGTAFTDASAEKNRTYVYFVTSQEWSGLESDVGSNRLQVGVSEAGVTAEPADGPVTGWDTRPPPAVTGFKATRDADDDYHLSWDPSPARDLRYYNIYYAGHGEPAATQQYRIASPPGATTSYIDWGIPEGDSPAWLITAVDRQGNESGPTTIAME